MIGAMEHLNAVHCVRFSPDNSIIASASRTKDKNIILWDMKTGKEKMALSGHTDVTTCLNFAPDSKMLASGSKDNTIKIWDMEAYRDVATLNDHKGGVNSLVYSSDGSLLASCSFDKSIILWDTANNKPIKRFIGHTKGVQEIAFSPDDKMLASGSLDNTIKIWDIQSGAVLTTLEGHKKLISAVCFTPDGKKLVSSSHDQMITIWDTDKWKLHGTIHQSGSIYSLAISKDSLLASSGVEPAINLWNIETGGLIASLKEHRYALRSLDFSSDGKHLVSGSDDKTARLWDLSYLFIRNPIKNQIKDANEKYKLALDMKNVETVSTMCRQ